MIEDEAIPLLGNRQGFQDELAPFVPGRDEAVETSRRDRREDVDAGSRPGFQGAIASPGGVVGGRRRFASRPSRIRRFTKSLRRSPAEAERQTAAAWPSRLPCCSEKKSIQKEVSRCLRR